MISRVSSGSSRSDRVVYPVRSEKSTVTAPGANATAYVHGDNQRLLVSRQFQLVPWVF